MEEDEVAPSDAGSSCSDVAYDSQPDVQFHDTVEVNVDGNSSRASCDVVLDSQNFVVEGLDIAHLEINCDGHEIRQEFSLTSETVQTEKALVLSEIVQTAQDLAPTDTVPTESGDSLDSLTSEHRPNLNEFVMPSHIQQAESGPNLFAQHRESGSVIPQSGARRVLFRNNDTGWMTDELGQFAGFSFENTENNTNRKHVRPGPIRNHGTRANLAMPRTPPSPEVGEYGHLPSNSSFTESVAPALSTAQDSGSDQPMNDGEEEAEGYDNDELEEESVGNDSERDAEWDNDEMEYEENGNESDMDYVVNDGFEVEDFVSGDANENSQESTTTKTNKRPKSLRKVDYETMEINEDSLLISQRGHPLRHLNGRLYRFCNKLKEGEVWRCLTTGCGGRATLLPGSFELRKKCTIKEFSRKNEIEALRRINHGKILWVRGHMSLRKICDLVRDAPPAVLKHIPPPKVLARRIRRMCEGKKRMESYPFSCDASEPWLQFNGKPILLYNDTQEAEDRMGIIILSSTFGRRAFVNGTGHAHMDGEMKRNTAHFAQTYNVGVIYEGVYVNSFTCFVRSREQRVYEKLFGIISDLVDCSRLRSVSLDFEIAVANAASKIFPGIKVSYCTFHWRQNLFNQCDEKGFDHDDPKCSQVIKFVTSLNLLPPEDIKPAFDEILDHLQTLDKDVQDLLEDR